AGKNCPVTSTVQVTAPSPDRPKKRKKRGGFCRPPRQLYPQEERGIQRAKYRGSEGGVAMCVNALFRCLKWILHEESQQRRGVTQEVRRAIDTFREHTNRPKVMENMWPNVTRLFLSSETVE